MWFNRDKYWINSQSLCARSTMVQCNSRPRASVVFFPWAHHRFIIHSRIVLDAFDAFDGDGHRSFSMHSIRSMVIGRSRCIRFVRYVEANFPGARPCDRRSTFDALDAFDALARASARR